MNIPRNMHGIGFIALAWGLLIASPCDAQLSFDVIVDTSVLIDHPAGPFSLAFKLTDGSGFGDNNNHILLDNFAFGDGGVAGLPDIIGEASGDLSSSVTLDDSEFLSEFVQPFDPGDTLTFHVDMTTNRDRGAAPDEFAFKILDCMGAEIPTTGLGDSLLIVDINSRTPVIQAFAGDFSRAPSCGGEPITLAAPRIVPEPSALALLFCGVGSMALLCLHRRKTLAGLFC
jgi:hypothetical protein